MNFRDFIKELEEIKNNMENVYIEIVNICPSCGEKDGQYYRYNEGAWCYNNPDYNCIPIVNINEGDIVITITHSSDAIMTCDACIQHEYAEEYSHIYENAEWESMCFHHGISAFYAEEDNKNLERIEAVTNCKDMQICCSTEHIGPYGITCSGKVLLANRADMWSHVDPDNGKRVINGWQIDAIEDPKEVYSIEGDHNEIIMEPSSIEGIWYKPYTSDVIKERLRQIAEELRVFCYEVGIRR